MEILSHVKRFFICVDEYYALLCALLCKIFAELYSSKPKRYLLLAFFVIVLVLTLILKQKDDTIKQRNDTVKPCDEYYTNAAVAADARICSEIGGDMLKRGGSVVDAAIAALLCLSVVNPHSMGIGGGVVFTIYNASTGKVETINAKETAPGNAFETMLVNLTVTNKTAGLLIAVPGELRGYKMAHERHGRLQWKELFNRSIELAEKGFRIGKALARAIKEKKKIILDNESLCEVFCDLTKENKTILKENDIITFPTLAETYKKIAEEGPNSFYNGSLAQSIVNDTKAAGGIITLEDLQNYQPVLNEYALNFTVGNYTFHVPDAPFGGPVLALILNILEDYGLSSSSVSTIENKILTYHRMIEAIRFADVEKCKLGDPLDENITKIAKNMTLKSFANKIRNKIKDNIKQNSYAEKCENCVDDDLGTSHLSIIAEDGSAVAVTSSINNYFGSQVRSNSTGIIFNDQMNDFSKPKNECVENNLIKPGKRPRSSMCPTIILDKDSGKVKMVVGGSGGTNITTAVAQVILNYLFFDYDLKKAVEEPRVQIRKETIVEDCFDVEVTKGLIKKNHTIFHNTELSAVQAVVRQGNKLCAESDCRKGGYPAGY